MYLNACLVLLFFFFSSRRRHTRYWRDWSSDVCSSDLERDVHLYINSPGGSVSAGLAIYDTMQFMKAPVNTICMGFAASMGCFLLAAGRKGKRSALPHARIMQHQPSGGAQGTAADIEVQAKEIVYLRAKVNALMAKHTGRPR